MKCEHDFINDKVYCQKCGVDRQEARQQEWDALNQKQKE